MVDNAQAPSVESQPLLNVDALMHALPVAVYTTDKAGLITSYNECAAELWGRRPRLGVDQWCGSHRLLQADGEPMAHDESPMAVALRENRALEGEKGIVVRPNGTRVPVFAYPRPIHDASGALTGAVNTLVDISARELSKQAERRLVAIVESSHDAIVSKDLNGIIATWNMGAQRLFGYTADEVVGKPVTILIPPDRQEEEPQILQRIRNGEVVDHFETIRMHKDGRLMPISLTISPVRSEDGRIIGVSKIARDITEQKESQSRIQALMREVNHRVKNQLAVIISMIRETSKHSSDSKMFVQQVQERILSLSRSHDLLVQEDWRGATMFELLLSQLKAFGQENRVILSGPSLLLQPIAVQHLGIAFHELATNSVKYGVLSQGAGTININWTVSSEGDGPGMFRLVWTEAGGPRPEPSARHGFGSVVLRRVTPAAMSGKAELDHTADGVVWSFEAPLEFVEAQCAGANDDARMSALEDALRQP